MHFPHITREQQPTRRSSGSAFSGAYGGAEDRIWAQVQHVSIIDQELTSRVEEKEFKDADAASEMQVR
jgi:hypothetical protein